MRFTGHPQAPTGLRRLAFRLPIHLYRLRLGGLLGQRFVLINHLGRKSGLRRQVVVEVVDFDAHTREVVVASGFGRGSDWYRNLLAHPDVTIQLGARSWAVHAERLSAEEGAEAMAAYSSRHPRAARGLCRFMGFEVDGSADDYRAVGRELPMLRLVPRQET